MKKRFQLLLALLFVAAAWPAQAQDIRTNAQQKTAAAQNPTTDIVLAQKKIAAGEGGFTEILDVNDYLGSSMAPVRDFNGDGIPDLVASAQGDDDAGSNEGAFYILYMSDTLTVKGHQKIYRGNGFSGGTGTDDFFGRGSANLGDVDGDGVEDLALGAWRDDERGTIRGAVYILFMNDSGTIREHQKINFIKGGFTGDLDFEDFFGTYLAPLGDLDGDGVPDLAVSVTGDDGENNSGSDQGGLYILFLKTDGTVKSHKKIGNNEGGKTGGLEAGTLKDGDTFGDVGAIGDLDGDGIVDLAVGALGDDDGGSQAGALYILFMNRDGTVRDQQRISANHGTFEAGLKEGDTFGRGSTGLGDLDGDGVLDIAVGASQDDGGGDRRGAVYLLYMNVDGTVKAYDKISDLTVGIDGIHDRDLLGFEIVNLGDYNDDGSLEIAVASSANRVGGVDQGGAIYIFSLKVTPADAPPAAPTGLSATAGTDRITLNWNANSEGDFASYQLFRSTAPITGDPASQTPFATPTGTSFIDTDVSVGTTYYYRLTAVDDASQQSGFSAEANATIADAPPAAPTGLSATASTGQIALTWLANNEADFQEYRLYRDTQPFADDPSGRTPLVTTTNTAYTDVGLTGGTTYYYRLTAVDDANQQSGFSAEASAMVPQQDRPPAAPTGLTATAGNDAITLNWNASPETDLNDYWLFRDTQPITGDPSGLTPVHMTAVTSYTDTGVTAGTAYFYRLVARDDAGQLSPFSNEASATVVNNSGACSIDALTWLPKSNVPGSATNGICSLQYDCFTGEDDRNAWLDRGAAGDGYDGLEIRQMQLTLTSGTLDENATTWSVRGREVGRGSSPFVQLFTGSNELVVNAQCTSGETASTTLDIAVFAARLQTGGPILGGLSQTGDRFFLTSTDKQVYVVDSTGQQVQSPFQADQAIFATSGIDGNNRLYVGAGTRLYAFDTQLNNFWDKGQGGEIRAAPAVSADNSVVYIGTESGLLKAVRASDGQPLWSFQADGAVISSPTVVDVEVQDSGGSPTGQQRTLIFFGTKVEDGTAGGAGTIYAVEDLGTSGSEFWTRATPDSIVASPALDRDGTVYVGTAGGTIYRTAWDGTFGSGWQVFSGGAITASPVIDENGIIYVASRSGQIVGYEKDFISTSQPVRRYVQSVGLDGTPGIGPAPSDANAARTLFVGTSGGDFLALTPFIGQEALVERWSLSGLGSISAPTLVTETGMVYIGTETGDLYVMKDPSINPNAKGDPDSDVLAEEAEWPTFKGDNKRTRVVRVTVMDTDVEQLDESGLPRTYALDQNYPNPFNPVTTIRYALPTASEVRLAVYDVRGSEVAVLHAGPQRTGVHEVVFDGRGLASGVYLYRLETAGFSQTRRLVLLK